VQHCEHWQQPDSKVKLQRHERWDPHQMLLLLMLP
jgi:hypothetical protein